MRAVIWTAYGPPEVLQLQEIEKPRPKDNQVLVKVVVSNIFAGDCELRRFEILFPFNFLVRVAFGFFKPRGNSILGQEYAGEIVEVGKDITRFKPGDRVFGAVEPFVSGSYAEYVASYGRALTTMPEGASYEEAAVLCVGGLNALHGLRVAEMGEGKPPQKILLNGAGGSIGTLAIQLAKDWGAEVTAVDATHKLEKLREIGADHVIDYTREDFTGSGETYDVVMDIIGKGKSDFFKMLKCVKPGGYLILMNPPFHHLLFRLWAGLFSKRKVRFPLAGYKLDDLDYMKNLVSEGRIRPVIEKSYPLHQIVEAHRYMDTFERIGNVVLQVQASS